MTAAPNGFRRLARWFVVSTLFVAPLGAWQAADPHYSVAASLPDIVDGQPLRTLEYDFVANRLYAGSRNGLFWSDLTAATPKVKGPIVRKDIFKIAVAPDLGRVFYATPDEVGYVDVRNGGGAVQMARMVPTDLVYEPSRQELYVASREPKVAVFDARSGERGGDIALPGWFGFELETGGGRVFLEVGGQDGLFVIDAATHQAARWPVDGRLVTPAMLEADPSGRTLFAASNRELIAIDVATAKVTGKLFTGSTPSLAFDRGTGLLLATWWDQATPNLHVEAFRADADGLTAVDHMRNPSIGGFGLMEPTSRGFIQQGFHALVVWAANGAAAER